jgi:hypothetical protein
VLLLVTIGLVLVGAVSLVIGFVSNQLGWIYLSILCSLVAAGVLVLFSRMSKRQGAVGSAEAPTPMATDTAAAIGDEGPATAVVPVGDEAAAAASASAAAGAGAAAVALPIAGYDSLRVNDILPKLSALSLDELDVVREHEEQGKNRNTVLSRVDDLMEQKTAAEGVAEPAAEVADAAVAAGGAAADDTIDDLIEDYDNLRVNQILPLLEELDDDELEDVADYEEAHKNRASVVDRIDQLLGEGEAAEAGVPAAGPAKKAAAAKKAPAKKAVAKKTAAPVKKAPAKRAAATTTKKAAAPAKKAAAPAKKTAGPAKKAAAPAKRSAAPAKKTVAKKAAAPAKKAAKATKR